MFLGPFYGMKLLFEFKIDDIMQKGNRLGFPKMPSKSQLSLCIIKIIARKDKRFSAKYDQNGRSYCEPPGKL